MGHLNSFLPWQEPSTYFFKNSNEVGKEGGGGRNKCVKNLNMKYINKMKNANISCLGVFQTYQDYSFTIQVPFRKLSNSIINTRKSVCPFYAQLFRLFSLLIQACQNCPIEFKFGMTIPNIVKQKAQHFKRVYFLQFYIHFYMK